MVMGGYWEGVQPVTNYRYSSERTCPGSSPRQFWITNDQVSQENLGSDIFVVGTYLGLGAFLIAVGEMVLL